MMTLDGRQGVLFELGEPRTPIELELELELGTRRRALRRSRATAWRHLVRLETAPTHDALRQAWVDVLRDFARGRLDHAMRKVLGEAWMRRSEALRLELARSAEAERIDVERKRRAAMGRTRRPTKGRRR